MIKITQLMKGLKSILLSPSCLLLSCNNGGAKISLWLFAVLFLMSCSGNGDKVMLHCDSIENIQKFPKESTLSSVNVMKVKNLEGCEYISVKDSFLLCEYPEGKYYFQIINMSNSCSDFIIEKGKEHNEYPIAPSCVTWARTDSIKQVNFFTYDNKYMSCVLNEQMGKYKTSFTDMLPSVKLDNVHSLSQVNDTTFFLLSYNGFGYERSILSKNNVKTLTNVGNLNDIKANEDINVLSAVHCVNKKLGIVAEAMLRLNQINLYSFDGTLSKTLCIGGELSDVADLDGKSKWRVNKMFSSVRATPDFFVALYYDVNYQDYMKEQANPSLLFFDWKGNPLQKLNVPYFVKSFDITEQGDIYLLISEKGKEQIVSFHIA